MNRTAVICCFLIACGKSGNSANPDAPDHTSDAPADGRVFLDAPPNVPAMITIAGTANEDGESSSTPMPGVAIAIYKQGAENTPLATATTNAQGTYSVTITTNGEVVDGFIKATISGYMDNYVYPAAPFQADTTGADADMISTSNFGLLGLISGQTTSTGCIVAEILDTSMMSVEGATITSSPAAGSYRYDDSGGTPSSTTSTSSDGASFFFNAPVGQIQINAAKVGATFKSHTIVAHANAFTTTVISE